MALSIELMEDDLMTEDYTRKRHSVSKLVVHLIFTTKYRRKVLTPAILQCVKQSLASTAIRCNCQVLEINGDADHVHILISYPPNLAVSRLVNVLKTVSSRTVGIEFPGTTFFRKSGQLWSHSYFAASAGGVTIEILEKYVKNQWRQDLLLRHSSPPQRDGGFWRDRS